MSGHTLASTVFVADPKTHGTLILAAGTEVTDPAITEQITHPDAWAAEPALASEPRPSRPNRRTKTVPEAATP